MRVTFIDTRWTTTMRVISILAAIGFLALGCSRKEGESSSESSQSITTEGQRAEGAPGMPGGKSGDSSRGVEIDPALKDYEYPGAAMADTISMGNTVSVVFKSPDEFDKVVGYYAQKFPEGGPTSGGAAYFGKQNPDGSAITVTVTTFSENVTQIILKLEK